MVDDQSTKQQPVMLEGACHEFEILPDDNKLYVDVSNPLSVSLILSFNNSVLFLFTQHQQATKGKWNVVYLMCRHTFYNE